VLSARADAKMALLLNGMTKKRTNGSLVVIKIDRKRGVSSDAAADDRGILESVLPVILRHTSS